MKRICKKCNTEYELSCEFFFRDKKKKEGLCYTCKKCKAAKTAEWIKRNPERSKGYGKEKYHKNILNDPDFNKKRWIENRDKYIAYNSRWETRLKTLLRGAKGRARERKLEFDLDLDFLKELWINQDGKCLLTRIPFILKDAKNRSFSPSIDKIDCTRGYTKDNIRLVIFCINLAMGNWGKGIFDIVCKEYSKINLKDDN